ncbi:MAG: hypothetical protein HYZ42_04915 [Bacteroidetes bacterium]|nr:hypothetical protein [Bacteroidota bacterium]
MKYILFACCIMLEICKATAQAPSLNIDNEVFRQSIRRIIHSAETDKLNSLKGEQIESVMKSNGKVEKWKALDSLPGQINGYITQSFCTSYRAVYKESSQINEEFSQSYEEIKKILNSSLSKVDWLFREDTKEDGTKRLTISSLIKANTFVKPNLILEVVNKKGIYILQLSVTI